MITSASSGRATTGLIDAYLRPYSRISRNPIVWCHGHGGNALQAVGAVIPSMMAILAALTNEGFQVVAPSMGNTWGNQASQTAIAEAIVWGRTLDSNTTKTVVMGTSMGGAAALQYALSHIGDVSCIVLFEPALDLEYIRTTNTVEGITDLRASIDAAWGFVYPATMTTGSSPLDIAGALSSIPIQLWYATDDDISHNYASFATSHGNTTLKSLGAVGHTDAALAAVTISDVVSFVKANISSSSYSAGSTPAFFGAGTLAANTSGTLGTNYPASVLTNHIAILAEWTNSSNTFVTPSGWNLIGKVESNTNQSFAFFWRRLAADSEAAPTLAAPGGSGLGVNNGHYARMYVYSGCRTTGTPFTNAVVSTPTLSTTPSFNGVKTLVNNCRVAGIVVADDDNTWSSGQPPTNWTNNGGIVSTTTGGDSMTDSISREFTTPTTVGSVTIGTMSASDYWGTLGLALLPT